jgi:hypothetical protein
VGWDSLFGKSATNWPVVPAPDNGTMNVERSVEWELSGETEVLGENLSQCHYPPQIQHDLGSNPGRRGGKPATKCQSYGTSKTELTIWMVLKPADLIFDSQHRDRLSDMGLCGLLQSRYIVSEKKKLEGALFHIPPFLTRLFDTVQLLQTWNHCPFNQVTEGIRDSVVCISTSYGLDDRGGRSSSPDRI